MSCQMIPDSCCDFLEEIYRQLRKGYARSAAAVIGSMANVRPILYRSNEGTLTTVAVTRSRHAALEYLAEKLRDTDTDSVFISHCGCPEAARELEGMLDAPCKIQAVRSGRIGPVVAVHTALGVLSVFF